MQSGNFCKLQPVQFIEGKTSIVTISVATFALWIKINLLFEREMYDDTIGHLRVLLCLFFKTSLSAKPFT